MDWFICDNGLRHERVKSIFPVILQNLDVECLDHAPPHFHEILKIEELPQRVLKTRSP